MLLKLCIRCENTVYTMYFIKINDKSMINEKSLFFSFIAKTLKHFNFV